MQLPINSLALILPQVVLGAFRLSEPELTLLSESSQTTMRFSKLPLAYLLTQGGLVSGQGQGYTNESDPYYGLSPPVYPSRRVPPTHLIYPMVL